VSEIATIGSTLGGRYLVEGILGAGAHGRVFAGYDLELGAPVALKECTRGAGGFLRELSALFELEHPNILRCHTVLIGGPYRYIVTELMDGGSLRERIDDPGSTADELLAHFRDAVVGVAHAHDKHLVHRDLKPENILLRATDEGVIAKVSDFGISTLDTGMSTRSCTGSPAYMAPEQFYDAYDARIDVYALGVILFELLCGSRPFYGSPAQIMIAHLERAARVPDWVPPKLTALIERALAKDPDDRIPTVAQFLDELDAALSEERELLRIDGWPVSLPGTERIHMTREAIYAVGGGVVTVLDRRGRQLDRLEGVDEIHATDQHALLRRGSRLELCSARGDWTPGEVVPANARIHLSPDGSVAVVHEGGLRVVDRTGAFEVHPSGASVLDACFTGDDHCLVALRDGPEGVYVEGGETMRSVRCPGRIVVGHTERFEILVLGDDCEDATVLDTRGPRRLPLGCRDVVCDGENFLGVDDRGRLVTINGRTGRVARTFVDSPLATVGACSDGTTWATREGRLVSVR